MAPRKLQQLSEVRNTLIINQRFFKQVKKDRMISLNKPTVAENLISQISATAETDPHDKLRPQRESRSTPSSDSSLISFSYCGVVFDFARWPGDILRSKGPQLGFENFDDFLAQENADKCFPGCLCLDSDDCPCVRNKTVCDLACSCENHCRRRFVGCGCRDACSSDCWCHKKNRQCGEFCSCTDCGNDLDPDSTPRMRVQPSTIPGAGEGLFAMQKIGYKRCLGSYEGETIVQRTSTRSIVMDFRISRTQCVRPDPDKSRLFKINHAAPEKANVQFLTFETKLGRQVLAFAVMDILPGTELLAWYGPEFSKNASAHQVPLTKSLGTFTGKKFDATIKANGAGYEMRPLKRWQEFVSLISWNGFDVGQDVFVNFKKSTTPKTYPETISDERFLRSQLKNCWIGRILEIKVDMNHQVRVVVAWYDRDYDSTEQFEFHGLHQLDVLDGSTLSSRAEIMYVRVGQKTPKDKLFYRFIQGKNQPSPVSRKEMFLWADVKKPLGKSKEAKSLERLELLQP